MRELRLRWDAAVSHAGHDVQSHAQWTAATPALRTDLAIIVKTANELYGARSHWIEERERRQADRKTQLAFGNTLLQGSEAASPYARQFTAGFFGLKFQPALEGEFAAHIRESQRRAAFFWGLLALALWLILTGVTAVNQVANGLGLARGIVVASLVAGIFLLAARRDIVRTDLIALVLILPLIVVAVMQAFLHAAADPAYIRYSAFMAVSAGFFPIGLRLLHSFASVLLVLLGCTFLSLALLPANAWIASLGVAILLLSTAAVSAVGAYFREHSQRGQFLLKEVLAHQVCDDLLTGLQNRRGADRLAEIVRLQSVRESVSLSFVMIEIEESDSGVTGDLSLAHDAMLMRVAQSLGAFGRRPLDITSRLDTNTFGLLLYDCGLQQATSVAFEIRSSLAALNFELGGKAAQKSQVLRSDVVVVQLGIDEKIESLYERARRDLAALTGHRRRNTLSGA